MTDKWTTIINSISVISPDSINVDALMNMLDWDRTVDVQVLDNLYILNVLSIDEYKTRLRSHINRLEESVNWAKKQLKAAEDRGEKYNPMIFYACARMDIGAGIDNALNHTE